MEAFNEKDTHFSKLFTDDDYYQAAKEKNYALAEALDPEATAKRSLVNAYLEHRLGREIPSVNYEPERDAFAMQAFGQKNLNDGQLFDYIRGDYDWQKQRTEAINDLQMQSVGKAIADSQLGQTRPFVDGMTEVFNQWQQKYPELVDGKNDAAFLSQGYKLYYDTINDLDTVRPQASKALSTLTSFTQGNATDEDMQSLANDFVGAPPEDRQKIYKYVTLAAQAGQIDRAGIEQFAINMGQAFTRGFDFVPQGTLQMQEAGVNNWLESIRNGTQIWVPVDGDLTKAVVGNAPAGAESDAWRQATVPEAETLIQSGHNVRESFKVVRELRNVAKTGVDPIRPVLEEKSFWGTAERGAYGLSGSIPLMGATAVNPYLGVLAYQATEYDRIMLENPEITPQFAQGLALVEGAANAAIVHWADANLLIPATLDGLYINVETRSSGSAGSGVAGWDINPYSATSLTWFNATGTGMMRYPGVTTGSAGNLALGTSVGATGSFGSGAVVFGAAAGNWQLNASNYFGFRFVAADGGTKYGWGRFVIGASSFGADRMVAELAFEDSGAAIAVGAVPAPGAIALLGLAGLASRRRR